MTNPDLLPEDEREMFLRDGRLGLQPLLAAPPPKQTEAPNSGLSGDGSTVPAVVISQDHPKTITSSQES